MAVSPDHRFANLITSSAERGGWVPDDVHALDAEGDEELVPPRRIRLPVLVSFVLVTVTVLIAGFVLLRPAPKASPDATGAPVSTSRAATSPSPGPSTGSAAPSTTVVVHVTGQVKDPSVVTLPAGSRVQDAVEAAGGLTSAADAEAVNLARLLVDGEQIHIPARGEEPRPDTGRASAGTADAGTAGAGTSGASDGAGTSATGDSDAGSATGGDGPKVDLNTADSTTLQTLPGVGPVTAEAIIAHRQETPFASVEDLLLVSGIGPKTLEKLRDRVTIG